MPTSQSQLTQETKDQETKNLLPEDRHPAGIATKGVQIPVVEVRPAIVRPEAERVSGGLPLERGHIQTRRVVVAPADVGVRRNDRRHFHAGQNQARLGNPLDELAVNRNSEALKRREVHPAHRPFRHGINQTFLASFCDDRHLPGEFAVAVVGESAVRKLCAVSTLHGRHQHAIQHLTEVAVQLRHDPRKVRTGKKIANPRALMHKLQHGIAPCLELPDRHKLATTDEMLFGANVTPSVVHLKLVVMEHAVLVHEFTHPLEWDATTSMVEEGVRCHFHDCNAVHDLARQFAGSDLPSNLFTTQLRQQTLGMTAGPIRKLRRFHRRKFAFRYHHANHLFATQNLTQPMVFSTCQTSVIHLTPPFRRL